jgi:hypothetical protein
VWLAGVTRPTTEPVSEGQSGPLALATHQSRRVNQNGNGPWPGAAPPRIAFAVPESSGSPNDWKRRPSIVPFASGGGGLVRGPFLDRSGRLVASAAQEGVIRMRRPSTT